MDTLLRAYVLLRDGGCVARYVGDRLELMRYPMLKDLPLPGLCRNGWGSEISATAISQLELDHVEPYDKPSFATRPPDEAEFLWALCPFHHRGTVAGHAWATLSDVRAVAPLYISAANTRAAARGLYPPRPLWWEEGSEEGLGVDT